MHRNTKLTERLREEVYRVWEKGEHSMRGLAREYHVDKKIIQRIIARGKEGDFSVRNSTNHRYLKGRKQMAPIPITIEEEEGS